MRVIWKALVPIQTLLILLVGSTGSLNAADGNRAQYRAQKLPIQNIQTPDPINHISLPESPDIAFGAPGTTYSFQQRYGTVKQAYIEDSSHLISPFAVSAHNGSLWIADSSGNRVLKFDNTGLLLQQIGKAGFREHFRDNGISLDWLADVDEDASGRVWIVDGGASHVSVFSSTGVFQFHIGVPWDGGNDNSQLNSPRGVGFDFAGNVYIADTNNHRIQIFDAGGNYIHTLGSFGQSESQFDSPHHLTVDADNHLYVADTNNHRIQIFDVNDPMAITFIGQIGVTGECNAADDRLCQPTGVDVDAVNIYIADTANSRIQIFDRATLVFSSTIAGGPGSGTAEFDQPADVAVDSSGNLFVADEKNHRVQMYEIVETSYVFARTFGETGIPYTTAAGLFDSPTGIEIAGDNSIYLTEGRGNRLVKLNSNGSLSWVVGEAGIYGEDEQHLHLPQGVALDDQNRVFVADSANHRVQIFNANGQYLDTLGSTPGTGDDQFDQPFGVAVAPNGNILVADFNNHRIQIFNSSLDLIHTLGQTGVAGLGTDQFANPRDVAVDPTGIIYVLDYSNHRVQVFDSSFNYRRTIGDPDGTGQPGSTFSYLSRPTALAVDPQSRNLFVGSSLGSFINVYSPTGAFLTRISSSYSGSLVGQFLQVEGLAADANGNLYASDALNHVVEKWGQGVPDFRQINLNGFGDSRAWGAWSLAGMNGDLYVGTYASTSLGAAVHRYTNGSWQTVASGGFGDKDNFVIDTFAQFGPNIYAGIGNYLTSTTSSGGEIWRSPSGNSGTWNRVVSGGFDSAVNGEIVRLAVFERMLYAATWSWDTSVHGAQIWRSSSGNAGTWERIFDDAIAGESRNEAVVTLQAFDDHLYAGTWNGTTGGELWRSDDGENWSQVSTDGFGDSNNSAIISLAVLDDELYAAMRNTITGGQIWRSPNGTAWSQVIADGFGNPHNARPQLIAYKDQLYAVMRNTVDGSQIWRSPSGDSLGWSQLMAGGLGQGVEAQNWYDWSLAVVDNNLYIGTTSPGNGGARVWLYVDFGTYLPLIRR